ncbi:MAG: DUF3108 domain-containing protein [Flavobacterium sp.]
MKKIFWLFFLLVLASFQSNPPKTSAYQVGEFFKFKISYGFVNAGFATLEVKEAVKSNKKVFHMVGKGYTTGMTKFFFKVEDDYQSFVDKTTGNPIQYIRKINEGGYTKDQEGFFDPVKNRVTAKDYKSKTEKIIEVPENIQDIMSAFYYLRNYPKIDELKIGHVVEIDMFFDEEITKFKLKYLGNEDVKTKFGIVPCRVFRPYVQSGRVFKEQESLSVWISDDANKLPIKIKANLMVGSLNAEIDEFKGLKNSFTIKTKKK